MISADAAVFPCPFCGLECRASSTGFFVEGQSEPIPAVLHLVPICQEFMDIGDAADFLEAVNRKLLATATPKGNA